MGFAVSIFIFLIFAQGNALSSNYYDNTCPDAENIVTKVVTEAVKKDKTVPAAVLRMHFHDCFIRVYIYIFTILLTNKFSFYFSMCFLESLICSVDFLGRAAMRLCC